MKVVFMAIKNDREVDEIVMNELVNQFKTRQFENIQELEKIDLEI
jgi:hypothetical protein